MTEEQAIEHREAVDEAIDLVCSQLGGEIVGVVEAGEVVTLLSGLYRATEPARTAHSASAGDWSVRHADELLRERRRARDVGITTGRQAT